MKKNLSLFIIFLAAGSLYAASQYPSQGAYSQYPSQGAYSQYPSQGASTQYPSRGGSYQHPSQSAPSQYPSQGAYSQHPSQNAYSQHPSQGATYAQNSGLVQAVNHPQLGKILTDSRGITLYMFTPDQPNVSNCYDQCSVEWPPLLAAEKPDLAPGLSGRLDVIQRRDNTAQVTYNGMPLYYYFKDKKTGDVTGQNVDNKWFVINPDKGSY